MEKSKIMVVMALVLVLSFSVFTGCSTSGSDSSSAVVSGSSTIEPTASATGVADDTTTTEELTTVRIGVLPYLDYTLFVAAKDLGYDKEMGLDFELVPFTLESQAVQALLNGSIDIAQGALGSFVPLMPEADNLRVFMTNNQYTGFTYVGRTGEYKTFDEFYDEYGNFEEAQKATLEQFKGKTFCMVESSFESMLKSTLELVSLDYSDATVMNFSNDAQAALAFMRGEGDFYTGSTTQITKLMQEPENYQIIAKAEVLGDAGLWYSNSATTEEYLNENSEIIQKVMAVHYKTAQKLADDPDTVIPSMINYLKENASSDMTLDEAKEALEYSVDFYTLSRAEETVFNPDSEIYWRSPAEKYVSDDIELGSIAEGSVDLDTYVVQDTVFSNFLNNDDLINWINE